MEIIKAIKNFNESIETLAESTAKYTESQEVIDETIKREIEQQKKEAEKLLKRIRI